MNNRSWKDTGRRKTARNNNYTEEDAVIGDIEGSRGA